MNKAYLMKIRGGVEVDSQGKKDVNGGNPACNQGGVVVVEQMYWDGSQIAGTLTTSNASGAQRMPDKEQFNCVIERVVYPETTGALMASGYNKLGTQEAMNDMFVVCEKTVPKAVSMEVFHCDSAEERTAALKARGYKDPQIIALDRAALNQGKNAKYDISVDGGVQHRHSSHAVLEQSVIGSLCASDYKFPQQQQVNEGKVVIEEMENEYIVRRLTPTECCRLQGFPDGWGEIDPKDDFTDEEYAFWLDVRSTFDGINGRKQKDYTKEQMLTWYNKLHTDSAEYKMWGNGISLPTAYFVLRRMKEQFEEAEQ